MKGLVDGRSRSRTPSSRAMPPTTLHARLPVRHRLARARRRSGRACCSRDLLDRAGVKPKATALRFVSFDGAYTESLTLEQARRRRRDRRVRARGQAALDASTAGRCGSTSRRCTATSRASGSRRSRSPTDVDPGLLGATTATTSTAGSAGATAATTSRRDVTRACARARGALPRFDRAERVVHWCNATLFLVLIATGASLVRRAALDARRPPRSWCARSTCTPGLLLPDPGARRASCCAPGGSSAPTSAGSTGGRATTGAGGRGGDARERAARQVQSRVRS